MIKDEVKVIAVDLDGTLLDNQGNIQELTKKALLQLQERGIKVVMASGRPINGMLKYARQLRLENYGGVIVSYNGAVAYDMNEDRKLFETPIDKELVAEVLQSLEGREIYPMVEDGEYMLVENVYEGVVDTGKSFRGIINVIEYEARGGGYLLKECRSLKDSVDFNVNKILTIVDSNRIDKVIDEYKLKFENSLHVVQTSPFFMEFMSLGVNKAYGLKRLGIEANTLMAFGDSMNDLEMIQYAKYAIVMGNGQVAVKNEADYVTLDCNNEGIYHALKHFELID